MEKLLIHNPCNEHTRYFRDYNLFWDQLTEKLSEKYQIEENRYYKFANSQKYEIQLKNRTKDFLYLNECEYVIENLDTGDFYILSVADDYTDCILGERNNPHLKKVLLAQFIDYKLRHHVGDNFDKYSPWIYFPQHTNDFESLYFKRKNITNKDRRLYFRGNILDRPILDFFDDSLYNPHNVCNSQEYFDELINFEVGLSIAGRGEMCYRDVEYMALGIPFIRYEYQNKMFENLIPNFHYISIDYDTTIPKHNDVHTDRLGLEIHAKKIIERYHEVIDDKSFLSFIAKNAREYYIRNLSTLNRVEYTMKILGL